MEKELLKGDILLVQIYVNDIIFGSTNKDLCKSFEKLMNDKFQMSSMGELTFFLGLKVKQKKNGIFISQDKYVAKILRKFRLTDGKSACTPIDTKKPLLKDPDGEDVDVHTYRSMIGSLMYLTSSRPDIMFALCACARFQVTPKASHLHAVKMIFRYHKGKPHLGLWYPKDSPFDLVAYLDSDYAGASLDRKSTTRGCQFLGCRLISCQLGTPSTGSGNLYCQWELFPSTGNVLCILFPTIPWLASTPIDTEKPLLKDHDEGVECLPNEEIFAELARMGYEKPSTKLTFYKAFFSSQWKFLIHTILQCMSAKRTSWNEFSSSMASAIICLSSGRNFNFSKYIFDKLVKNVDILTKFYMYLRFLQLMIRKQVGDLSTHTTKYTSFALTQKVFANMRQVGKGFFSVDTPLFEGMLVAQEVEEGDADENVENVNAGDAAEGDVNAANDEVPTRVKKLKRRNKVKVLKLRRLQKVGTGQRVETSDDTVMDDVSNQERMIAKMDQDANVVLEEAKEVADDAKADQDAKEDESEPAEVQEVVDVFTTAKLITEVVTAASTTITTAEVPVPAATTAVASTLTAAPRRGQREYSSKEEYDVILKECCWFQDGLLQGMSYDDIRPIFEAKFNLNVAFLKKTKEKIKEEESRALKRINETLAEKAAKRRKLDEEVEELKRHLQIVPNEDDDVYIEATPLAQKLILLVERKYPLTRFTLDQMLNAVRLEVEEESKVSLELLSFGVDAAKEFKERHAKCLMLLVKDLVLPSQVDAVD
nr:uncharacterized mitochondrial protein AtMg00810-like [Tanacetum cinerariifolium]